MLGQLRRAKNSLAEEAVIALLQKEMIGHLATVDENGQPYVVPLHFVYEETEKAIYFHSAQNGHKLDNLAENDKACFEVCCMQTLNIDENPCDTSTAYQSAVAFGQVAPVLDEKIKQTVLRRMICKYFPSLKEAPISEKTVAATKVLRFTIHTLTGKFHG